MYVKRTVHKRETPTSPLKIGACAIAHNIEDEDIANEIRFVVSLTTIEK